MTLIFLTGDGMPGGPLHHKLHGAPLIAETRTAPRYRFYSVGGHYPALEPAPAGGFAIEGEIYDVPLSVLRDQLLPAEPAALELGMVELADGGAALAMMLRREFTRPGDLADISETGSWRKHVRHE
jgi:gamma-glutamylcyclotransferase (GGCT)/AIG2-like uncharacterized protein YtfP